MAYLQILILVIGLLVNVVNLGKETVPVVCGLVCSDSSQKALFISRLGIDWRYSHRDEIWVYYSDYTGRYWCRLNSSGICEYCERP